MLLQQCHPNLAGSLVIARRTEYNPHCFLLLSLFCQLPLKLGQTAKVYRYRYLFIYFTGSRMLMECHPVKNSRAVDGEVLPFSSKVEITR